MRKPFHVYGGVEHTQQGPSKECLLCRLEAIRQAVGEALTITRGGTVQMPKEHWDRIGQALATPDTPPEA